jgi:hypothetical protein
VVTAALRARADHAAAISLTSDTRMQKPLSGDSLHTRYADGSGFMATEPQVSKDGHQSCESDLKTKGDDASADRADKKPVTSSDNNAGSHLG